MCPWRLVGDWAPLREMKSELLLKSCKRENLPQNRGSIRIGSLDYFRRINDEELRDADEGCITYQIKFVGEVRVQYSWLNDLTFGYFGSVYERNSENFNMQFVDYEANFRDMTHDGLPGDMRFDIQKLTIIRMVGEFVDLSGYLSISYKPHNCLAFCCHHLQGDISLNPNSRMFENYDAYWSCSIKNRGFLAFSMATAIATTIVRDQISPNHNIGEIQKSGDDSINVFEFNSGGGVDGLNLMYTQFPVSYASRTITVLRQSDVNPATVKAQIFHSPFLKSLKYSRDREYRIVFRFFHKAGSTITGVRFVGDYLEIPIESFTSFIDKQSAL